MIYPVYNKEDCHDPSGLAMTSILLFLCGLCDLGDCDPIWKNKANFGKDKMNAKSIITRSYNEITRLDTSWKQTQFYLAPSTAGGLMLEVEKTKPICRPLAGNPKLEFRNNLKGYVWKNKANVKIGNIALSL